MPAGQEFSAGVKAVESYVIHFKQASSKHLISLELGILELQSHSWPSAKPPTLLLGSSVKEPKRWKAATGLELLESWVMMQCFGNHQLCLHGSASCAFHSPYFERCHAQTKWKGKYFPCQGNRTGSFGCFAGNQNKKYIWKASQEVIVFTLKLLSSIKPQKQSYNTLV